MNDGFLTESDVEICAVIRGRYAPWFKLLRKVNAHSNGIQHALVIHTELPSEIYAATLFARTLASTQAAVILLERGMVAQARCVLRAGLETLITLAALVESPDKVLEALVGAHRAEQRRVGKNVGLWKAPELQAIAMAEKKSGRLDQLLQQPDGPVLNTYQLAEIASLEDVYRSLIRHSAGLRTVQPTISTGMWCVALTMR